MPNLETTKKLVGPSWAPLLVDEFNKPYMQRLGNLVGKDRSNGPVYPKASDTFRALWTTPYEDVRVVIVGQDPYHTPGMADGLAFSVRDLPDGQGTPPSLVNIFREVEEDVGFSDPYTNTDLTRWAEQGVLLLNASLSVKKGEANSHSQYGWHRFTSKILELTATRFYPTFYIAWGSFAKGIIESQLDPFFHGYTKSPHPSPLSAHRGFFGSKPFSKANTHLVSLGDKPIDW